MTGRPYAARAAFGLVRPKAAVRGRSMAGVVAAVGAGVQRFQPGDERDGPRYDVIIDTAGSPPLSLLRRALTPRDARARRRRS